MKFALVTQDVVLGEGQGRVNYEIVRYAIDRGHEVKLVASRVDASLLACGVDVVPIRPIVRRPALLREYDFARQADSIVPDLKSSGYFVVGNGFSLRAPHDLNVSHMVHAEWQRVEASLFRSRRSVRSWYHRAYTYANCRLERQAYAAAHHVVAVSEQVRESLIRIGISAARITVIPNGVDTREFQPAIESRKALGLPEEVPLALFVGDLRTPRKNLDTVLKSLPSAPQIHLAVVGDTTGSPYPQQAREAGLNGRVQFLGRRNDVGRLMRTATFCVFPSHYDPFGLVVLESLASGTPVIVSRAVGASSLITPACGVVLDDPSEPGALAVAMKHLCDVHPHMSLECRRVAESQTWEKMAATYLNLFEHADDATAGEG